ncbi:Protein DD3-3 [Trichoplax sp. H2]|nr:Protein DD3-3 [Trichoplax sp. H2]|eukprot:RDD42900.1 Protein DD3-3 [Trichoplax sp. H2]
MVKFIAILLFILHAILFVHGDVYLHNPRGSNNRLDEATRPRANANRLFNSENNNRGGYNVGNLYYYAGTVLNIEWTNQHSCNNPNNHCNLILQYMCHDLIRDGVTTRTIPKSPTGCSNYDCNRDIRYGMHETYDSYKLCEHRTRNKGLFTADQKLKGNGAIYTRQNPAGTRRGYECPEERDYYPYWHHTQWKDIAILTSEPTRCPYYKAESHNVKSRWQCVVPNAYYRFHIMRNSKDFIPNNKKDCENLVYPSNDPNGTRGKWSEYPSHGIPAPDCREADWSRDNHLGNTKGGYPMMYNWTIPNDFHENCVLRMRYNISTKEFDGWSGDINSTLNSVKVNEPTWLDVHSRFNLNQTEGENRGYVYEQNPNVRVFKKIGNSGFKLQLAINTNQFGRTFQDRSHRFAIRKRPKELEDKLIHNLNVRGKRGNIVQVYPAVEYDFVPNTLMVSKNSYVHVQWTGSNTNPNNNDGQGRAGTDRSNIVMLRNKNYPEGSTRSSQFGHWGNNYPSMLARSNFTGFSAQDLVNLALLSPNQFGGEMSELDDAGTYFDLGPRKVTSNGVYYYMSTRNNNFSNRSQKGRIVVIDYVISEKKIGWNGGNLTRIKQAHGTVNVGDGYASDFLVVYPFTNFSSKSFDVTLKLDSQISSEIHIYHSSYINAQSWTRVPNVTIENNIARFSQREGGLYVARTQPATAAIAGIVIAIVAGLVVIIGSIIYFRRRPEAWANLANRARNIHRSLQSKV